MCHASWVFLSANAWGLHQVSKGSERGEGLYFTGARATTQISSITTKCKHLLTLSQRDDLLRSILKPIKCMQRKATLRNLQTSELATRHWQRIIRSILTIFCPSSSFVPRSRTTTGTFIFKSRKAKIIPSAIISQRVSPPKILTNTALTRVSEQITRNDALTVSEVALPPVSRKFAQWPPWIVRASTVFMARPAPLTTRYCEQTFSFNKV